LEYEVKEEGTTGFLGIGAKPAVIKAAVKVEEVSVEDKAKIFLKDVFEAMNMTVVIDVKYDEVEKNMDVDLSGDDMGVLIGKRGQTLDSLQYLVSLVVNKDSEEYIRVKVDTEDYRNRRKETLENLAKNIAYKVKRTKRTVSLEPMNPYERRIIHSALQNDKYVTTHSEGEEPFRRVVVTLKRY
jgi:spoIIIJ-associated protein